MQHGTAPPHTAQCNTARHGAAPPLQPSVGPLNLAQPTAPLTNLPKAPLPQAAHPFHTPPRETGSPVLPLAGKGSHGAEFGFMEDLGFPPSMGALAGALCGCGGLRLAVPETEMCHHAGVLHSGDLPCHQRNWQRGQPRGRGAIKLLALWTISVPAVGHTWGWI